MKIIKISAIWCPGCLVMKKVWNKIRCEYPNIDIVELDYDMDSDRVSMYNPGKVLPVTIFLDNSDNELERIVGEFKIEELEEKINKYETN